MSRRGKPKIHHRGHFYVNQYCTGPKAYRYWACVKRYCKGRLNMDKYGRIVVRGEHTHSVNDTGIVFSVVNDQECGDVEYLVPSCQSKIEKIILKSFIKSEPKILGKIFTCRCGKEYKYLRSLQAHLRYECGKPPMFNCIYCPYAARHRHHLKVHTINRHLQPLFLKDPNDANVNIHLVGAILGDDKIGFDVEEPK